MCIPWRFHLMAVFVVWGNTSGCFHDLIVHAELFITDYELNMLEYFRFVVSQQDCYIWRK